jgi:hypothetical protein
MIPTADILHWQQHHAAWTNPAHVEQDLIISRALVELFAAPELAANLAFRGGTALHKLHLAPARRFSEDIDLVQIHPMAIGSVLDQIHGQLDPWLGRPKWKQTQTMCTLTYRFTLDGPSAVRVAMSSTSRTRSARCPTSTGSSSSSASSRTCNARAQLPLVGISNRTSRTSAPIPAS